MKYTPVIGLEIHLQPKTLSKMFCSCSSDIWKKEPNTLICPVCFGLPGALPVPNKEAIRKCQILGILLNCKLAENSKFDRKNYFYPDLPKGYQISQYDEPFCFNGFVNVAGFKNTIRIRRVHMEEDTGKSFHEDGETRLDFNKSGMPLIEIVTEPDFSSPEEVYAFGKYIRDIVRQYQISDCDMEKGQMRLEVSVSLKLNPNDPLPNYRIEIKNINSFKFARDALSYEIKRQSEALDSKEILANQTRGFKEIVASNGNKQIETFLMREKEVEKDYRYFPEPDIPPFSFSNEYLAQIRNEVTNKINSISVRNDPVVKQVVKEKAKFTMPNEQIVLVIDKVIAENSKAVSDYNSGKENAQVFLLGQILRITAKKADPLVVKKLLQNNLDNARSN